MFYDIDNTSTPLLWYRGVAYFSLKNYELALKDFKQAYQINPNHIHVLNNLGTTYQLIGNSELAKLYYKQAIKVNPTFKEVRVNLSAILFNEKKYDEALSTILNSKVEVYWKRQKNNDNYDLYLKTIFNTYINNIKNDISNSDYKKLMIISNDFISQPARAAREIKKTYLRSQKLNLDFIKLLVSN